MSHDHSPRNTIARVLKKQQKRIRFETTILLSLVILAGWLTSVALFHLGFHPLWARYLTSVTVGYGLFLLLYWLWMKYVITDLSQKLQQYDEVEAPHQTEGSGWDFDFGFADGFDLEFIGVVVGILAIVLVACFVIFTAPALLLDVLTSEVIVVFIVKKVSSIDEKAVFLNILKNTYLIFLVLCLVIALWALTLQAYFPDQDSFSAVVVEFFHRRSS